MKNLTSVQKKILVSSAVALLITGCEYGADGDGATLNIPVTATITTTQKIPTVDTTKESKPQTQNSKEQSKNSTTTPDSKKLGRAVYVDSRVKGVVCKCGDFSSKTDENGEFTFVKDEECRFVIEGKNGVIELQKTKPGEIKDDGIVVVDDIKTARLLQSLDSDGDPENGIEIEPDVADTAVDVASEGKSPEDIDSFVDSVKEKMAQKGKECKIKPVSKDEAKAHLERTLAKVRFMKPESDRTKALEDLMYENGDRNKPIIKSPMLFEALNIVISFDLRDIVESDDEAFETAKDVIKELNRDSRDFNNFEDAKKYVMDKFREAGIKFPTDSLKNGEDERATRESDDSLDDKKDVVFKSKDDKKEQRDDSRGENSKNDSVDIATNDDPSEDKLSKAPENREELEDIGIKGVDPKGEKKPTEIADNSNNKEEESSQEGEKRKDADIEVSWVKIEGGEYFMGRDRAGFVDYSFPKHRVTIPTFEIAKTETTVAQYRACVEAGVCSEPAEFTPELKKEYMHAPDVDYYHRNRDGKYDNYPVHLVNWRQAKEYCEWVGGRLPTEAEWEYAARSQGKDYNMPWGQVDWQEFSKDEANVQKYVVSYVTRDKTGERTALPVCSHPAGNTEQGVCDMVGNVAEWVMDRWHLDYTRYPHKDQKAWLKSKREDRKNRVLRGGSFTGLVGSQLSSYSRTLMNEDNKFLTSGIRCVK